MLATAGITGAATAETTGGKTAGVLAGAGGGALLGAQLGSLFGPGGTLVGGLAGGLIGGGAALLAASKNERQIGTMNATGKAFEPVTRNLTVHSGERVLSKLEAANVSQFDTKPLEKIMSSAVAELTNTGRDNKNILRVLNTQVAIQDRQRNTTGTYLTT
jgi:gas vesicle protein